MSADNHQDDHPNNDQETGKQPDSHAGEAGDIGQGWFDDPKNVNKVVWTLVALCVASVLADFFYHKHTHYGFQELIGFDAIYGFVSCVLLVLAAKQLRKVLMRDEDYYD